MLAELYHSPATGVDNAVGTSTLGSSEAIMLAGLAMKKRWQARMEAQGKPTNKPNLIMGYNVQVAYSTTTNCHHASEFNCHMRACNGQTCLYHVPGFQYSACDYAHT